MSLSSFDMKYITGVLSGFAITLTLTLANGSAAATDDAQILRVERGLMTPVVIAGQPPHTMTLQERMQHYHIPSVSIAFFDASGIRWVRAYGATPATLFQAGSISKPVSAVGIMRLVQDGRLNLDANVNTELTSWKLPENALTAKQPVTLRELLSHTAGTTVHGYDGYGRGKPVPTIEQVLDGTGPANSPAVRVDLQPGTEYRYSGGGYVIAELLAVEAAKESFATYMRETVIGPMGMTDSTFEQPLPEAWQSRAAVATDAAGKPYPGSWHVYPEQTAAGLWTTPSDLAKFAIGVQHSLDGSPDAVLSKATAIEMLTPVKDGYALGFEVAGSGSAATFGHNGANAGFQAQFIMHRGGEGVAIMTDSDNGIALIGELLASVGAAYGWNDFTPKAKTLYPIPPERLARFTGVYDFGSRLYSIEQRDSSLFLVGSTDHRLYPESPTKFFMLDDDLDLVFKADASGTISGVALSDGGETAKKLPPFPSVVTLDAATLASYAGSYKLQDSTFLISVVGNRVFSKLDDQVAIEIFPSAKDRFFVEIVNASITFSRDTNGSVNALTLHQSGRNLEFKKAARP
jgi:CubicO group peptidase (beta-lactamase class C family)